MLMKVRTYILSLLRDDSGANAVEYGLIMALVAVFIIAGVLAMSGALGRMFNAMAQCLNDATICTVGLF